MRGEGSAAAPAEAIEFAAVALGWSAGPDGIETRFGFPLLGGDAAAFDAGFGFTVEGLGDGGRSARFREGKNLNFVLIDAGIDVDSVAGLDVPGGLGVDSVGLDAAEIASTG